MYFEPLIKLIKKTQSIDLHALINKITDESELHDLMIKLNQMQLQKGLRSDGSILPDYSETSVKVYGKPAEAIRLYDTGEFYNSFDLSYKPTEIFFTADPIKYDDDGNETNLFARYSVNVMGLVDDNLQIYIDKIREKLIKAIRERINVA